MTFFDNLNLTSRKGLFMDLIMERKK